LPAPSVHDFLGKFGLLWIFPYAKMVELYYVLDIAITVTSGSLAVFYISFYRVGKE
jgi:hypothetical protein